MMTFGSSNGNVVIGGFAPASSSNLSPLAPPFTVDRSTSRSPLNFNAAPYSTPYTWGNSQALDYHHQPTPAPASETVTASLFPSSTAYSVSVSPPAGPGIDHAVYSSSSLTDSISFSQFPTSLMTNDFGDGNFYAPPLHWSTFSVVGQDDLGYKSSSTLNSVGITQDNYTQSLYGLHYPSKWDPSCDGGLDIESGGKSSFLDRISPEVPDCTDASAYRNYFKEGSELHKVLGKSSGESWVPHINNVSNLQHNPVGSLGTDAVVDKPFPEFNAKGTYASTFSVIPSKTSGISFTASPDTSIMDFWGHLIQPTATNATGYKQHFLNQSPSAPTSFHEVTIGHPPVVSSSTTSGSLRPQTDVMHGGNDLPGKCDDIAFDHLNNARDPWVCQISKQGQEIKKNVDISASIKDRQRYDYSVTLFPTKYGEPSGIKNLTSGPLDIFKHEVADMHDTKHKLEGFSVLIDDQYNPSEDSPCWKGSSSYFSQFEVSEPSPSQHHLKSKNSYDGLNFNEPRTFSLSCKIPTTLSATKFHEKSTHGTNGCCGEAETLVTSTKRGYIDDHLYVEPKSDVSHTVNKLGASEQNSGKGFCFPNDNHRSVDADAVEMEPFRVKVPEKCNPVRLCLETICFGADKEKPAECTMNANVNLNDAPEECQSYVPSNAAKRVLSSLSSDADISSKHNQENWDEYASESKSMLLKTIVNLLDSLLFYYSNDENPVGNDDYKILELVRGKLTMCLKSVQEKSWIKDCSTLKQRPSNIINEVQACYDEMTNKPQVTKAKYHEDGAMLGSNFEGLCKSTREYGTEEAGSMTKAIKDILDANFHEDTGPHLLALEAEAVLCSTNYKARYHRIKNEMEKSGSHEEKEKSSECKASPTHMDVLQESLSVGKSVHAADIMERYTILKCRAEISDKGIGDELDSSKISLDQKSVEKLSTQVNGHTTTETTIKDANTGCQSHHGLATKIFGNPGATNCHTDMADDHVMSRLRILKSRGDYPKFRESEQQPSEVTKDSVGTEDCSQLCGGELLDGRFKPTFETGIAKATVVSSEDGFEGAKCASGSQPNCQKFAHNSEMVELGVQFCGGWYENTSSDWEHVLKNEFTWTGESVNP